MRFSAVLILLLVQACSPAPKDLLTSDEANSKAIVGTWAYNNSEWEYGFIEYQASGDKCEIGFEFDRQGNLSVDFYWNKWTIKNGVINTTMHATNTLINQGQKINDEIRELSEHNLTVYMIYPEGDWSLEYHYRSSDSEAGKVCELVKMRLTSQV